MMNSDKAKCAFLHRLGDAALAEKKYFDTFHRELCADDYIEAALDDCRAYFGSENIPEAVTNSTVADIAYIRFQMDTVQRQRPYGLKSSSYSEGTISKSEAYLTEQEMNTSIENILKQYSRFRVVSGRVRTENSK